MNIFITGMAGMIGFHTAKHLTAQGHTVTGIDNFNDYYEVSLKQERARILREEHGVATLAADIISVDYDTVLAGVDVILHLAAYANPRHSLDYPQLYIDNNITGTQRLIEGAERMGINNVVYASSSCVMHEQPLPWKESDHPGHQNNPYGWTKRANECQFIYSKIKNIDDFYDYIINSKRDDPYVIQTISRYLENIEFETLIYIIDDTRLKNILNEFSKY